MFFCYLVKVWSIKRSVISFQYWCFFLTFRRKFGVYEIVVPVETTPSRIVPEKIELPDYITGKLLIIPKWPEVKDEEQIDGMRQSCRLASDILSKIRTFVKVCKKNFVRRNLILSWFTLILSIILLLWVPARDNYWQNWWDGSHTFYRSGSIPITITL